MNFTKLIYKTCFFEQFSTNQIKVDLRYQNPELGVKVLFKYLILHVKAISCKKLRFCPVTISLRFLVTVTHSKTTIPTLFHRQSPTIAISQRLSPFKTIFDER